jgi:hypothetical protein
MLNCEFKTIILLINVLLSSKVVQRLALKGKAAKHRSAKLKNIKINMATGHNKVKYGAYKVTFFNETLKFVLENSRQ